MTTLSNDYNRTTMKGIDILLQQHQVPRGPGYAVAVYQRGQVIYSGAAGLADIERNVSLTAASVFDIASVSKQFTAAALVILEKQGLLSLDDRLVDYLDGLPEYCNSIRLRHLLNHTSGMRDYNELLFQAGVQLDQAVSDSQALAMIKRQYALEFAPGEKFEYSNTGYFLLALVVQVVTGKTLSQFSQQAILTPLEMANSYFWGRAGQDQPPVAKAYCDNGNDGYEPQMANWQTLGDGALCTNTHDLLKWDNIFYTQDPYWRNIAARLQQPGMLNNGVPTEYGLGLEFGRYRGQPIVFHDGCWGGYLSQYLRFPEQRLSVVVLSNDADGDPIGLAESIADIVLANVLVDEPVQPELARREAFSEPMLQALPGRYEFLHDPENGFEIVRSGEQITLLFGGERVLYHAGDGQLVNDAGQLTVIFDMQQNQLVSWLGARTGKAFKVRKINDFQPSKADLNRLVGRYISAELNTQIEICHNGQALVMISAEEVYQLEYCESDLLKTSHEDITRLRIQQSQGTVSLFTGVHNVLNIEFVKT